LTGTPVTCLPTTIKSIFLIHRYEELKKDWERGRGGKREVKKECGIVRGKDR
jgi:hypothetical protein